MLARGQVDHAGTHGTWFSKLSYLEFYFLQNNSVRNTYSNNQCGNAHENRILSGQSFADFTQESEANSEPCQTFKMARFVKIINFF